MATSFYTLSTLWNANRTFATFTWIRKTFGKLGEILQKWQGSWNERGEMRHFSWNFWLERSTDLRPGALLWTRGFSLKKILVHPQNKSEKIIIIQEFCLGLFNTYTLFGSEQPLDFSVFKHLKILFYSYNPRTPNKIPKFPTKKKRKNLKNPKKPVKSGNIRKFWKNPKNLKNPNNPSALKHELADAPLGYVSISISSEMSWPLHNGHSFAYRTGWNLNIPTGFLTNWWKKSLWKTKKGKSISRNAICSFSIVLN